MVHRNVKYDDTNDAAADPLGLAVLSFFVDTNENGRFDDFEVR